MSLKISNGNLTATIKPLGAELASLKDKNGREYMWDANPKHWAKHSPVLFPIVGMLRNNSYFYNGKIYAVNRHGFARDNEFVVKQQQEDQVTFSFSSNKDTVRVYPFTFELNLKYTLRDKQLFIDYTVINNSNEDMPFSIGAHPAFALPGNFSNYSLQFEKQEELVSTRLENELLSSNTEILPVENATLPLSYKLFERDALVFKELKSDSVTILEKDDPLLKVSFKDFPHLGIWTKVDAPFICIEPWHGYADKADASGNLSEKEGIITLNPQKQFKAGFSIEIF